jgi:pyruvate,water dikinase
VITSAPFRRFASRGSVAEYLNKVQQGAISWATLEDRERVSIGLRHCLLCEEAAIRDEIGNEVLAELDALAVDSVAVRSSATVEDSAIASFAGQFDSTLNVHRCDVLDSVVACWLSLYNARALFYFQQYRLPFWRSAMAVIVQEMIHADFSGVMFTQHYLDNSALLIEFVEGYGERLVHGAANPAMAVMDRATLVLTQNRGASALPPAVLSELGKIGLAIEASFGVPQDIEFCVRASEVVIVQSRPITNYARSSLGPLNV